MAYDRQTLEWITAHGYKTYQEVGALLYKPTRGYPYDGRYVGNVTIKMKVGPSYRNANTVTTGHKSVIYISPDFVAKIVSFWNAERASKICNLKPKVAKSLRQTERVDLTDYFNNMHKPMVPDRTGNNKFGI